MSQKADFDFAGKSAALAAVVRKAYEEADPIYFERVIELFGLVIGAAHRQGVADEALQLLIQYFDEREKVLEGSDSQAQATAAGTGTLQ